jgi:CTP:molybdopterin cytidylyltransferase MocA
VSKVAAVLLAAGRSKRMGAFKPLLPFGKQTVIESTIDYLRRGGVAPDSIVVVLGHRAEEILKRIGGSGVRSFLNPDPDSEMSASIAAGIGKIPSSGATLITPADLPAVPPSVVSTLICEWQNGSKLVIPTWQNRGGHPVLIDLHYRTELQNLDSKRGLKGLFEAHQADVKRIPVDSPFIARDMDTWDDYVALHQEVFGEPLPAAPEV